MRLQLYRRVALAQIPQSSSPGELRLTVRFAPSFGQKTLGKFAHFVLVGSGQILYDFFQRLRLLQGACPPRFTDAEPRPLRQRLHRSFTSP